MNISARTLLAAVACGAVVFSGCVAHDPDCSLPRHVEFTLRNHTDSAATVLVMLVNASGGTVYNQSLSVPARSDLSSGRIFTPDGELNLTVEAGVRPQATGNVRVWACPAPNRIEIWNETLELVLPPPPP